MKLNQEVKPEIILDNNYMGRPQVHMGLVKEGNISMVAAVPSVKFDRNSVDFENFKKVTDMVSNQYAEIKKHIEAMKKVLLTPAKAKDFIVKAMAYREPAYFVGKDGAIHTDKVLKTIDPSSILQPLKDKKDEITLWDVFSLVQEKMVKGEFNRKSLITGRVSHPRELSGAARNIRFNKKLWNVAEEYVPKSVKVA